MTVTEVSRLTGVSVRTLHHYHAIGLLEPMEITSAGYRLYGEAQLRRLHEILLLRELEFPLKEIKKILDSPGYRAADALEDQIKLLELRRAHLDGLITQAKKLRTEGENIMDFTAYNKKDADRYAAQAKEKWGATQAYREYEEKTKGQSSSQQAENGDALMDIFRELGEVKGLRPQAPEAQALVKKLQTFITDHYYTCTDQILMGLGQMYAAGGEMTENIDRAGGEGTGAFARAAIEIYCRK